MIFISEDFTGATEREKGGETSISMYQTNADPDWNLFSSQNLNDSTRRKITSFQRKTNISTACVRRSFRLLVVILR